MFADTPADLRDEGEVVTQPGGETRAFYTAVLDPGAIQEDGSMAGVFDLYPTTAGCYALQADGNGFEEVVVFPATVALMALSQEQIGMLGVGPCGVVVKRAV